MLVTSIKRAHLEKKNLVQHFDLHIPNEPYLSTFRSSSRWKTISMTTAGLKEIAPAATIAH
jgi:hypothetical protein